MNEKQKVEWYFNQGVNRPSDIYYISYDTVTFEPSLKVIN